MIAWGATGGRTVEQKAGEDGTRSSKQAVVLAALLLSWQRSNQGLGGHS